MHFNTFKKMTPMEWIKNLVLYTIGVGFMPLGVVLTINAHLGAGGYDALNFALADKLHINTSLAIYSTALLVLLLSAFIRRSYPRIETFLSSFFLGFFTDFWKGMLLNLEGTSIRSSFLLMLAGMLVIAFAVACYIISVFPTNPTDDLVVALNEKGISLGMAKMGLDVICVIIAFLLGGEIGVGTLICTLGLGPIIDVFHKLVNRIVCTI
ncbi:membrane protein [Sporanaerobium hydrogeniformans]|uniref:Membrane protein n=1 Tax=Sporanaerobium hydrogeniformans TaxID=3072179 RepID=A0AC61DHJ9_9FIRM|nr:membrane protein [Sporanaerobium hydrogeniformans]PHV72066.1 membrane protein [Sporanaerobium hydrogeniformans]